jgi:transglutaminase-like putative cysteine protease
MSGELFVRHDTEYEYSSQVAFAQHLAYLQPLDAPGQEVREFALQINPPPVRMSHGYDVFGNHRTYFSLTRPHQGLHVRTQSRVRLESRFEHLDVSRSPPWEEVCRNLRFVAGAPYQEASEFCFASPYVPRERVLREYAQASFAAGAPLLAGALDLMHRIHRDFRYDATSTDVTTTVLEAFAARAGVCQDFSHVMIACLRSLGVAARYVSGYLHTQARFAPALSASQRPAQSQSQSQSQTPSESRALSQTQSLSQTPADALAPLPLLEREPAVIGTDASHAWVAVHCPALGWVEFDPTNDAIPGTGHVRLASGRDYGDVAPLRGVVQGGGEHGLRVAVAIIAVDG